MTDPDRPKHCATCKCGIERAYPLNATLLEMLRRFARGPGGWVHPIEDLGVSQRQYPQVNRLGWWNFVSSRGDGHWRFEQDGYEFLLGRIEVSSHCVWATGFGIERFEGEKITVHDIPRFTPSSIPHWDWL